jgi:hypothetical protein
MDPTPHAPLALPFVPLTGANWIFLPPSQVQVKSISPEIISIFTLFSPRVVNIRPATPIIFFICLPTKLRMAMETDGMSIRSLTMISREH